MRYIVLVLLALGLAACDEVGPCIPEKAALAAKSYEACVQMKQQDDHGFGSRCGMNAAATFCTISKKPTPKQDNLLEDE